MKKTLSHEQYDALSESVREAIDEMKNYGFQDFRVDVRLWADGVVDHSEYLGSNSWVDYSDEEPVCVVAVKAWQSDEEIDEDTIFESIMCDIDFK